MRPTDLLEETKGKRESGQVSAGKWSNVSSTTYMGTVWAAGVLQSTASPF